MTPEARGGDITEGGFRSQNHLTLARVPRWLAEDGFTAMIREAHGDAEASFHAPGVKLTHEFVEYKDYEAQPSKLRSEVARFATMHAGAPGAYRRFVLSTRGLSATLRPVHAALERVRGALPFYADAPSISDASYKDFEAAAAGVDIDTATTRFISDNVVLEPEALDAERLGTALFNEAAARHLPCAADARPKEMNLASSALVELVLSRKAQPVSRAEIVAALATGLSELPEWDQGRPVRVHTHGADADVAPDGAIPFR